MARYAAWLHQPVDFLMHCKMGVFAARGESDAWKGRQPGRVWDGSSEVLWHHNTAAGHDSTAAVQHCGTTASSQPGSEIDVTD
jgi:hypothetical protein